MLAVQLSHSYKYPGRDVEQRLYIQRPSLEDTAAKTAGSWEDRRKSRFDRMSIVTLVDLVYTAKTASLWARQHKRALTHSWHCVNEQKLHQGAVGKESEWHP